MCVCVYVCMFYLSPLSLSLSLDVMLFRGEQYGMSPWNQRSLNFIRILGLAPGHILIVKHLRVKICICHLSEI